MKRFLLICSFKVCFGLRQKIANKGRMDLDAEAVFSADKVYSVHRLPRARVKTHNKNGNPKGFSTLIANKRKPLHLSLQTNEAVFVVLFT